MPSTIMGMITTKANMLRNGSGVAHGMAPGVHIAIYKECLFNGYYNSDIMAAMDATIRDGVEVLLFSLDGLPIPFYDNVVVSSSFCAVDKGISVIFVARNNGALRNSVKIEVPEVTIVGTSTLHQRFLAFVRIGIEKYLYRELVFLRNHIL